MGSRLFQSGQGVLPFLPLVNLIGIRHAED